jgi:hypothetical protein
MRLAGLGTKNDCDDSKGPAAAKYSHETRGTRNKEWLWRLQESCGSQILPWDSRDSEQRMTMTTPRVLRQSNIAMRLAGLGTKNDYADEDQQQFIWPDTVFKVSVTYWWWRRWSVLVPQWKSSFQHISRRSIYRKREKREEREKKVARDAVVHGKLGKVK